MDSKTLKIMVLGLQNVGKTSILYTLEKKYSLLGTLAPTKGMERSAFKIFGFQVSAWDLGGQEQYRKAFLQKNILFEQTDMLIFVLDVKEPKNYEIAFDYYQNILEILTELNQSPVIIILLNKVDPDTKNSPEMRKNIKILTDMFQAGSKNFEVNFFETSIYDEWSLIKAFSHGIRKLSTKTEMLSQNLAEFAKKILATAMILLNQNGYLIAEYVYANNEQSAFSCQSISTQCMYMYLVMKERNIVPEKITVALKDEYIVFREVTIEDEHFFIIFNSKVPRSLDLFNESFPLFAAQTKDIIKYFFAWK